MTDEKEKFHPFRSWGPLFWESINAWLEDRALRYSAALAYYSIFSMAPLVIIAISIAGLVFGEQAARGQIYQQMEWLIGQKGAAELQSIIQASSDTPKSIVATVVGIVTLLLGASGVFGQLKDALNTIWGVTLKPGGVLNSLKEYLLTFSMVLAIGFLLVVSLLLSAILEAMNTYLIALIHVPSFVAPLASACTFLILTVLFGLIYKVLPDVEIGWRDVAIGSVVTSILFAIGKYLISLYLGASTVASSFGAAGALILLLVWVYYSTTIFFLGAEFTKVFAARFGSGICPRKNAMFIGEKYQSRHQD